MSERTIHILLEQVASQIAAGEVVERPASALKELLENSIDAGARNIAIELQKGGAGLIAVSDDGCGMGREDAQLALRRHATSKIRDAADLTAVRTMGFRGEALASIASVARMRLRTRQTSATEGIELIAEGGELSAIGNCAIAPGTQIEVRDLFFNTPARLKFLKSVSAEQAAAIEVVQRIALGNYRLAFHLNVDSRTILETPRASSALERMRQLYGARLADWMLPFDFASNGMRVWGLSSATQESLGNARMILTYVDRRAVRDRALIRAITQAYQTLLPRGRYPAVALFLELPNGDVDVNVHPMKTEVRFRRSGAVFELVYHALRERLADQSMSEAGDGGVGRGRAERASAPPAASSGAATAQMTVPLGGPLSDHSPRWLRLVAERAIAPAQQVALGLGFGRSAPEPQPQLLAPDTQAPAAPATVPHYSELRIIGQLFAGYIALEGPAGLMLIDQHAAHERVTFERLRGELRGGAIRTQTMLTPATLELIPARAAQIVGALPELRAIGFEVEAFGSTTLLVNGAPAVFGAAGGAKLLADMIDSMGDHGFELRSEGAFDEMLKTLACHGSVRVGRVLQLPEISQLLSDLDNVEFKANCPHGRPVHIEFRRTRSSGCSGDEHPIDGGDFSCAAV